LSLRSAGMLWRHRLLERDRSARHEHCDSHRGRRRRSGLLSAGGGIVADSDPEREYQETLDKARGAIEALATPA
jgi:hypothetical protein